jgi:haloacetate dehalogenase
MFALLPKEMGVVLMDMPGYGQSTKPVKNSPEDYSKRAIGADIYAALAQLLPKGQRIVLVGHDRGGRVVHHMTVHAPDDGPLQIVGIVLCDIAPTTIMWYYAYFETIHTRDALKYGAAPAVGMFHWSFLAAPYPLPETLIQADYRNWLTLMFGLWVSDKHGHKVLEVLETYSDAYKNEGVIRGGCEDYRAGATIDIDNEKADLVNSE